MKMNYDSSFRKIYLRASFLHLNTVQMNLRVGTRAPKYNYSKRYTRKKEQFFEVV